MAAHDVRPAMCICLAIELGMMGSCLDYSRAEVSGALLACQEDEFVDCYHYMPWAASERGVLSQQVLHFAVYLTGQHVI